MLHELMRGATELYAAGSQPPPNRDHRPPQLKGILDQLNRTITHLRPILPNETSHSNLDEFVAAINSLQHEFSSGRAEPPPRFDDEHPPDRVEMFVHFRLLNDAYSDALESIGVYFGD